MLLKTPTIMQDSHVKCDVRDFKLHPGDRVQPGDHLAELRYEVLDDAFTDCPIVHYGDLVAQAEGVVRRVDCQRSGPMGLVLAEIGDEPGEFPVDFVTF